MIFTHYHRLQYYILTVVETAKAFETATITNELMTSAGVSAQEQVNYSNKDRSYQAERNDEQRQRV